MSVFRTVFIASANSRRTADAPTTTMVYSPQRKPLICYLVDLMARPLLHTVLRCALLFPSLDDQVRMAVTQSLIQHTVRTRCSWISLSMWARAYNGSMVASSLGLGITTVSPWRAASYVWRESTEQLESASVVERQHESNPALDLLMSSPTPSLAKSSLLESHTVSSGHSLESDSPTGTSCSPLTSDGMLQHPLLEPPVPRVAPTGISALQPTDANFRFVFASPRASERDWNDARSGTESNVDGKDAFALYGNSHGTEAVDLHAPEQTLYDNSVARRVAQLGYEDEPAADTTANTDAPTSRSVLVQEPCFVLDISADTMAAADSVLQSLLGSGPTPAPPAETYHALPMLPTEPPQFADAHGAAGTSTINWQWPGPNQALPEAAAWPPFESDSKAQDDKDSDESVSPWGEVESTTRLYPQVIGLLGEGGFGRVLLACLPQKDNALVALKVHHKPKLFREQDARNTLRMEQAVMRIVTENRLVFACHLLQSWETHEDIYFMMRMYPSDLLKEIDLGQMSPAEKYIRAAEMATGLCDLHHLGIMHRDLKPENILVAPNGSIAIADFGLSALQDPAVAPEQWWLSDPVGTLGYMAPELLCGDIYSAKVDVFALGIIFWQMFADTTMPIWDSLALESCEAQIQAMHCFPVTGALRALEQKGVDLLLIDLVKGMLELDQRYRFTAKQVVEHPFFNSINWNKLYARHKDYSFERKTQPVVPPRLMLDPGFAAWRYPRPKDMYGSDGQLRGEWKDVELDIWGRVINNCWASQQLRESAAHPDEFLHIGYFEDRKHGHVVF